jgi:Protein of unknown function (DUF3619)
MNEQDFSKKLTGCLNSGLNNLDAATLAKLNKARTEALSQHRDPIRVLGLVTVSGRVLEPTYFLRKPLFWLPILAIVVATFALQPQTTDDLYDASGSLDAKLLTGELPLDALLDNDFADWVKEQQEQTQPQPQ